MSLYMAALIILVLATLWTLPVLSAVYKNGDNHSRESKTNFTKSATTYQKLANSSTSDTNSTKSKDVNVSDARSFPKEEIKAEPRKRKPDIMTRILPMMIIPFMLQTAIIPMMLTMLKMMLLKSAFIGKMAIFLGFLNMFRNSNSQGGVYTHDINVGHAHGHMDERLAEGHYGYHGSDEYGPYINRKRNLR